MQKVLGIGGIFFKAKDPESLSAWYEKHLGVTAPPMKDGDPDWQQEAGSTVFAPMSENSEHFKENSNLYINFRVKDLTAMCRQLENAGILVEIDQTNYPYGKFASLVDPEDNQIQLWQVKQ